MHKYIGYSHTYLRHRTTNNFTKETLNNFKPYSVNPLIEQMCKKEIDDRINSLRTRFIKGITATPLLSFSFSQDKRIHTCVLSGHFFVKYSE